MEVLMPQLGETVTEGTVTKWHKEVGQTVTADEVLFEIGTDKVEMEVPAPVGGVLAEIHVKEGEAVAVGVVLALISEGEENNKVLEHGDKIEPPKERFEAPHETRNEPWPTKLESTSSVKSAALHLSPAVRRLLSEHNINAADIPGTGRKGRIKKADVIDFLEGKNAGSVRSDNQLENIILSGKGDKTVPFSRIRERTAEHMVRSKATSPHVHQGIEVDFLGVSRVREQKGPAWKEREGFSLTFLPFIARAVCDAIIEFPYINSRVENNKIILFDRVDLAIAVDLKFQGLVAPVIRNASTMTAVEIARAVYKIADRARANRLSPEEYSGATYTISNNGAFGTLFTTPIINQPQVAILSIDSIAKRPIVVEQGSDEFIAIRPTGILTQSFDHRAFDGAYSGAFLRRVKQIIETKDWAASLP
ncbi:MAG: dihydrolipoamide acetyltransferase family protein [Pseudomonadota bacterium]|nr:dihydrolipoamide acetyltransferase family protein [Pseudomonadota bacterium]